MNTKNNKKYLETEVKICDIFLQLLKERNLSDISITELCKCADITRATFYAHCKDLRELMAHTDDMLSRGLVERLYRYNSQPDNSHWNLSVCFRQLFEHVSAYRQFYRIYISHVPILPLFEKIPAFYENISGEDIFRAERKLHDVPKRRLYYHSSFFYAGMTSLLRIWLESDCQESIDEMLEIVNEQYHDTILHPRSDAPHDPCGNLPG